MRKITLSLAWVLMLVGMLIVATTANAEVALCVGCTSKAEFQGAAWQVAGTSFIGNVTVLVVNPENGQSQWVRLEHYPPGISAFAVPSNVDSAPAVMVGRAVPITPDPFRAIYIAGASTPHIDGAGISSARSLPVTSALQAAIDTAIAVASKVYFMRLDAKSFPSYERSETINIAEMNNTALTNAGIGWPIAAEFKLEITGLLKALKLLKGHSILVCDIFPNGDSVCVVPDPFNRDVFTQTGPAKDKNGNVLPDIGNRVPGGGGSGPSITQIASPPSIFYGAPSGGGGFNCFFVNGVLNYCLRKEE